MIKKTKTKFVLYDELSLIKKYDDMSKWQGKEALYLFKHLPENEDAKKPLAQCYKDRHYFSGIFRTKEPAEFSGDIKDDIGKRTFLIFNFLSKDKMKIFKRV